VCPIFAQISHAENYRQTTHAPHRNLIRLSKYLPKHTTNRSNSSSQSAALVCSALAKCPGRNSGSAGCGARLLRRATLCRRQHKREATTTAAAATSCLLESHQRQAVNVDDGSKVNIRLSIYTQTGLNGVWRTSCIPNELGRSKMPLARVCCVVCGHA
jgi:hypothetical protein